MVGPRRDVTRWLAEGNAWHPAAVGRRQPPKADASSGGGNTMTIERKETEPAFAALYEHSGNGDWNAWVDLFSEDCSFFASF